MMFCCCAKDSDKYIVDEEKQKNPSQTAVSKKETLPSSSQGHSTERGIKPCSISEKETPITHQPKLLAKIETKLTVNDETKLVEGKSNTVTEHSGLNSDKSKVELIIPLSSVAEAVSHRSVTKSEESPILYNDNFKCINIDLIKLEKLICEDESKSDLAPKARLPELGNQLKVLTSQVLASLTDSEAMGDTKALQDLVLRLEAVTSRLESLELKSGVAVPAAGGDFDTVSPFVLAYDDILSGQLAKFLSVSNAIGGDVDNQANLVKAAFDTQRTFLVVVSKSKQPDQNTFMELLKSSADKLQAVQDFRESHRKSEYFNHLSAISESIASLGWVTISPAPGPYVKEMLDAGTFYTNRVLKDFKEKDAKHVEWTKSWISTLTELQAYIKQFHTTGLAWNPQGKDAKSVSLKVSNEVTSPPKAASGAPPPPPPPGPPPPPDMSASNKNDEESAAAKAALFSALNKGEAVTQGLRKVTDDMKTHKNPALRQGPAPFKPTPASKPQTSPKPTPKTSVPLSKPPVIELQDKKWVIEYQKDNKSIVLDNTELKQTVYIYKCEGSVIQVKGKVNSIILDSCKKTAVVFDDLVSSVEFVNCQSMQAQVTGKVPTLSIDKTDGCLVYLSPASLDVEIVTAKSSEMNILVPQGDGDYKEFALPEQFKTKYNGQTMVTIIADSI